jgi:hypothetical protein
MKDKSYARDYTQLALVFVLALGLLLLSWPRVRASLRYLPVDTAIARYWVGETIPADQLRALGARARESLELHGHYRYWDGLSFLHYLGGLDAGSPPLERRHALESSIEAALEAVGQAPMKPMTWLRIAAARASLKYPGDQVLAALKMSIYTGRVEPTMLPLRLELGYSHLGSMDDEAVILLRDQTLLTWRVQGSAFVRSIRSGAIRFSDVERVLAGSHNDVLEEMEEQLGKIFR